MSISQALPHTSPTRGRPVDPRKDAQIVEAAGRLFMQQGVQATTMEQIAREADVSKLTLYRRYPDKNTLFTAVLIGRCDRYLPEHLFETPNPARPEDALVRLGCALLELITSEEGVRLNRVITTESAHNPHLTAQFYKSGPTRLRQLTTDMMSTFTTHGHLKIEDPAEASEMFMALIVGCEMNKRCAMNMLTNPTSAQIRTYVERAVAFFTRAYSK